MQGDLVLIETTAGVLEAEILRSLLASHDIGALLSQESAGSAIGLSLGPLGRVDILVDADQAEVAREIIAKYRGGRFSGEED